MKDLWIAIALNRFKIIHIFRIKPLRTDLVSGAQMKKIVNCSTAYSSILGN